MMFHSAGVLGIWVSRQRQNIKNGKLSDDKADSLNGLGFIGMGQGKGGEE